MSKSRRKFTAEFKNRFALNALSGEHTFYCPYCGDGERTYLLVEQMWALAELVST